MRHRFEQRRKRFLATDNRGKAEVLDQFRRAATSLRESTVTLAVWVEQQHIDSTPVARVLYLLSEWGRYSHPNHQADLDDALDGVAILLERIVYRQIADLSVDEAEEETHAETLRERKTANRKAMLLESWIDPGWHKKGRAAQANGLGCDPATLRRDLKDLKLWPVTRARSIDPDPKLLRQDLEDLGLIPAT